MTTKQFDNFADIITFTRASTGTYLDSDGLLKTATTNTPRIEYDINGNRKGLLIEEARTNLIADSNSTSGGTLTNTASTPNASTSPTGIVDAIKLTSNNATGGYLFIRTFSVTSGLTYTGSIFLKAGEVGHAFFGLGGTPFGSEFVSVNLTTGVVSSAIGAVDSFNIQDFGNGWFRVNVTNTAGSTGTANISVYLSNDGIWDNRNNAITLTNGYFMFGAQLEQASFPTSYIPTAGSTATRAADVASIPTSAFGFNPNKGTVVCEFEYQYAIGGGFPRPWELGSTSTAINRINVFTSSSTGNLIAGARSNDVAVASLDLLSAPPSPVGGKAAFAFAEDDFAACIDGGSVQTDTDGTMVPSVPRNTLKIGGGAQNPINGQINGHLKSIRYWPRRLTNTQLQELTA
jgi:hypothetical protein